jgi:cation diffusion facilitator CzcD-associated flavoprotein CzcO
VTDERTNPTTVDAIVVGAGLAGLYATHRLHSMGLSIQCFEAGSGVGGTWFWNRYPGARCDVESLDYSFSFSPELQKEWRWTERYATQSEILLYLEHVAGRYALHQHYSFSTRIVSAHLDESSLLWTVASEDGRTWTARFVIFATGPLSTSNIPAIEGLGEFSGRILHTGQWPREEVDFAGLRVAVIGTGSSGIQAIPQIAQKARHLFVFQRTPNFSIPARNFAWDGEALDEALGSYDTRRALSLASKAGTPHPSSPTRTFDVNDEEREALFEAAWERGGATFSKTFADQLVDPAANQYAVDFVHRKILSIVEDPEVAKKLLPIDHAIGAKRICVDIGYFETYNRDNVTLVDLNATPIETIEKTGIRTTAAFYEVDDIVLATGFDALTGTLNRIDIRGRRGQLLRDVWADGPRTFLGLAVAGFPNLFIVNGPGSPSVLANMVLTAEQHVDWIANAIAYLSSSGFAGIEANVDAQDAWGDHVSATAAGTIIGKGHSWYTGANIPGKSPVFMPYVGGLDVYRTRCDELAASDYGGFTLLDAATSQGVTDSS